MRLLPRGFLLRIGAPPGYVAAARQLLELGQRKFLILLGLVDPRDAHASQPHHIGRRAGRVLHVRSLEQHLDGHVAGKRLAERRGDQLDERILAVSPVFPVENHKNVILALPDKPVSEQPPDERDKLLVAIHASEQEVIRHRARVFHIQQAGIVLGFASSEQVIPWPTLLQITRLQIDHAVRTGQQTRLVVQLLRVNQQRGIDTGRHLFQVVLTGGITQRLDPPPDCAELLLEFLLQIGIIPFIHGVELFLLLDGKAFIEADNILYRPELLFFFRFLPMRPVPEKEIIRIDHTHDLIPVQTVEQLAIAHAVLIEVGTDDIGGEFGHEILLLSRNLGLHRLFFFLGALFDLILVLFTTHISISY